VASAQGRLYQRANSRVLEINPVTLEVVWTYRAANFFSTNISSAQRLPNGNTLITEGAPGRVFEVTSSGDIVWEYMNAPGESARGSNSVYRACRLPYNWMPQVPEPQESAVTPPAAGTFHVP
jgi:outer membrane protein assembly factor BamB